MRIGIIGYGWVGKAMHKLFPDAVVYDKNQPFTIKGSTKPTSMANINECDVAFVCVPTPLKEKKLDCSIVEEVVKECRCSLIVIRSTVMPGTTERLAKKYRKKIIFQPEYIGETVAHPMLELKSRPFLILGGEKKELRQIIEIYQKVYNANVSIRQVTATEAEVIKLSENRAIAFKVAQCQELYDACEKAKVDYYTIREAVYGDDPRFNLWFTFIYPQKRGFNSKCIPKDIYGWAAWAESCGYTPELTKAMLKVNHKYIKNFKNNI